MKGYCTCGKVIDEAEYTELGMCEDCFEFEDDDDYTIIKHDGIITRRNKK